MFGVRKLKTNDYTERTKWIREVGFLYLIVGGNIMGRHVHLLILSLILTFSSVSAHKDFWKTSKNGNVVTNIKTGFQFEEINKAFIIGELAEKLSQKLGYTDQVFLLFEHSYTKNEQSEYFTSIDNSEILDTSMYKEAIVIRVAGNHFSAVSTLKLLEYSIENVAVIKTKQRKLDGKSYLQGEITSIDAASIKELISTPNSELLIEALNQRIDRPGDYGVDGVTYYWQNSVFHFYRNDSLSAKTPVLNLKTIYMIFRLEDNSVLVFDTDSSFQYISKTSNQNISIKHTIKKKQGYFRPYSIEPIDSDRIAISFNDYSKDYHTTLIYEITTDILLDED